MPRWLVLCLGLLWPLSGQADDSYERWVKGIDYQPTLNDFGGVGLLATRTARMMPDGEFAAGVVFLNPQRRYFLTWQALPVAEVTFRYTHHINTLPNGDPIAGFSQKTFFESIWSDHDDGNIFDRGFDVKFRLMEESLEGWRPMVAVGAQDILGTGLFSGEYLVASKRFGAFDFTIGLGWGMLGDRGDIRNPLGWLAKRFDNRPRPGDVVEGGDFRFDSFFTGRTMGLFGGIEYQNPLWGFSAKLEYDGGRPSWNPRFQLDDGLPINIGLGWQPFDWLDLAMGWERGDSLMLRASLFANYHSSGLPNSDDAPPPKVVPRQIQSKTAGKPVPARYADMTPIDPRIANWSAPTSSNDHLFRAVRQAGGRLEAVAITGTHARLEVSGTRFRHVTQGLGRIARAAANHLPLAVEEIEIILAPSGLVVSQLNFSRRMLERADLDGLAVDEVWQSVDLRPAKVLPPAETPDLYIEDQSWPRFSASLRPQLQQHIGGREGLYLVDLTLRAELFTEFAPGVSFTLAGLGYIAGNLDDVTTPGTSRLPQVRTLLRRYLNDGRSRVDLAAIDWLMQFSPTIYGRLSGGIFEMMYGGGGGELLWKPVNQSYALGLDIAWLRQRDFDGLFGFRDYDVVSGFATAYTDLPFFNMAASLSLGRYLAKDWGGTLELSREFDGGIRLGGWVTLTDVPAEDFGEGSFDKGFYISFPLDLFSARSSPARQRFTFRPLTRDGGARTGTGPSLYHMLRAADQERIGKDWHHLFD